MNIQSIATIVYVGLLLLFGIISAAVLYHLRRYYLRSDSTQSTMGVAFIVVSAVLIAVATYFFLTIEWKLLNASSIF